MKTNQITINMYKGDILNFLNIDSNEFSLVVMGGGISPNGSHVSVTTPAGSYLGYTPTRHKNDLADIYTVILTAYTPENISRDNKEINRYDVEHVINQADLA